MLNNLTKETANNPGTGTTISLAGAPTGYVPFLTAFGSGASCYYVLTDGTQSEANVGVVTAGSPNTLARGTPIWTSTGSASRLNFTGAVTVYCALPAQRAPYFNAASALDMLSRGAINLADATTATGAPTLQQLGLRRITYTGFASALAAVNFTLPAGLRRFRLEYLIVMASGVAPFLRLSTDGTTYKSGASDYGFVAASMRAAVVSSSGAVQTYVPIADSATGAGTLASGVIDFDATTNYGTMDAVTLAPVNTLARWSGAFNPGFAGASLAVQIGAVGSTMSSGFIALSGSF